MASKRKTSIPCMIPSKSKHARDEITFGCFPEILPTIPEDSILSFPGDGQGQDSHDLFKPTDGTAWWKEGRCSCRPCGFETRDPHIFLRHVDSCHMDFHEQPTFHCASCRISLMKVDGLAQHNAKAHPELGRKGGSVKASLRVIRRDGVLTVEQILFTNVEDLSESKISSIKTPMEKMLTTDEHKNVVVSHMVEGRGTKINDMANRDTLQSIHIPTTEVNGTGIRILHLPAAQMANKYITNMKMHGGLPIWPSNRADSTSSLPKVMIPLSSIPAYDPAMDASSFLRTSFGKFPYPTKAEVCYLTVVSNYPEEQIKLWFTAQRLKQGISWSPEEIEETRTKMFSTVFEAIPIASKKQQTPVYAPGGCAFVQTASRGSSCRAPELSKGSVKGAKAGVNVPQPTTAQDIHVKQSVVQTPIIHTDTNNDTENCDFRSNSIMDLSNFVRKTDSNVNTFNRSDGCASITMSNDPYDNNTICCQNKAASDSFENNTSNTTSMSKNGYFTNSTICPSITTGHNNHISDDTSKDCNIETSCNSRFEEKALLSSKKTSPQSSNLLNAKETKSHEQPGALKHCTIHCQFPDPSELGQQMDVEGLLVRGVHQLTDEQFQTQNMGESSLDQVPTSSNKSLDFLDDQCLPEDIKTKQLSENIPQSSPLPQRRQTSPIASPKPPQVKCADSTAPQPKEHDIVALSKSLVQDLQPSDITANQPRSTTTLKQRQIDRLLPTLMEKEESMECSRTDKGRQRDKVRQLQKENEPGISSKLASTHGMSILQQLMLEEDQWEGNLCYKKTTDHVKTKLNLLHATEPDETKSKNTCNEILPLVSSGQTSVEHMYLASCQWPRNEQMDGCNNRSKIPPTEVVCSSSGCNDSQGNEHLKIYQHNPEAHKTNDHDKTMQKFGNEKMMPDPLCSEQCGAILNSETQTSKQQKEMSQGMDETVIGVQRNCCVIKEEEPVENQSLKGHQAQDNQSRDCLIGELLKA